MKKFVFYGVVLLMGTMIFLTLFYVLGFRINTSDSIPRGLYRLMTEDRLKNHYILFCPDKRDAFQTAYERGYLGFGFCPGGTGYLMKKVVAVSGDRVSSTKEGVYVNGRLQDFSKPKSKDALFRLLPQWRISNYRLKEGEMLVMTDQSEWSFDGRYYGLIRQSQIKGLLMPVWVQHNVEKR